MPSRALSRWAAPLLVIAGAALFGVGAGGMARVDASLDIAARSVTQPQSRALVAVETHTHDGVRLRRPHTHRREL
jgi:hypothetical protein